MRNYKKFIQEKLKILVFDTKGFISDCVRAFKELGHTAKVLPIKGPRSLSDQMLVKEISDFRPDFILTYDHTAIKTDLLTELKIPYASYFAETPFLWWLGHEPINKSLSSYCVLFMWDRTYVPKLKDRGFGNVFYLPLGADPGLFRRFDLNEEDQQKFTCDLSFAGRVVYGYEYTDWYQKLYDGLDQDTKCKSVIDEAVKVQKENHLLNVSDILEIVQESKQTYLPFKNMVHREMVEGAIQYQASTLKRKEIVEEIADLGLCLYGDMGWNLLIDDKVKCLGGLNREEELPKLYNASKINLNVTNCLIPNGLPMRAFDVTGCGGFLLTDYRPALGEFFELDKEVVCYMDIEDLRGKIKYYLAHPEEREEIARGGQERVLREHTYRHRMGKLISIMREIFG